MSKLYLAYGSNLNIKQMSYRCPTARPVGSAMIYGWELCFRGVADIMKSQDPNMLLPVGIWEIEPSDEQALDIYEGYKPSGRGLYDKMNICGIMTYTMNSNDYRAPSTPYFDTILKGYHDFGLDTRYLYDAAGWAQWEQDKANNVFELDYA